MTYPKPLSEKTLEKMYREAGLNGVLPSFLRTFFEACANLYGVIGLQDIWEIYKELNESKPALRCKDLIAYSSIARREVHGYYVYEFDELFSGEKRKDLDRLIIHKQLVGRGHDKYDKLYMLMSDIVEYPYFVPRGFLGYANPAPTAEEKNIYDFLCGLKATADECISRLGGSAPCEHKGKKLCEFSFLNWEERFEIKYLEKRPSAQKEFIEECSGTEAEKLLRIFKRSELIGILTPPELVKYVTEELYEAGVRLSFRQVHKLLKLITEHHNNTRHWRTCGWKPKELFQKRPPKILCKRQEMTV